MTIKEQHIEVSQSTQNIAANLRRKLLPSEMDWLLNKNQERFIQAKMKPKKDGSGGFEVDQLDADSIRTLLRTEELIASLGSDNTYSGPLPCDYSYLISDDSRVTNLCGEDPPAFVQTNQTVLVLPIPFSGNATPKYYTSIQLVIGPTNISLSDIATLHQAEYSGLQSKAERFLVQDVILWHLRNQLKMKAYWEKYMDIYVPGCILLPGYTAGSITLDGVLTAATTKTQAYNSYQVSGDKWSPNRLTQSNKVSTMLDTPFLKSTFQSPISTIAGDSLVVYGDVRFIVSKMRVDYVKKPRRMSLILGQDCELPGEFHQAICDLTVEYFKAMTADPNWEVKLKDNMLRSPTNT